MKPTFFRTPERLRAWFEKHHATKVELHLGYYKKASGKASVTYREALDEALCFGWIDGRVDSIDDVSWRQRWTPRTPRSYWSAVNIAKARALIAAGRMTAAGLAAFERRDGKEPDRYSHERAAAELSPAYLKRFKAAKAAWAWFTESRASYRRAATYWVMSARQEATRERRLATLIESSAGERYAPPFRAPSNTDPDGKPKSRKKR